MSSIKALPYDLTDRIPTELFDRVIDYLHTDKPSLLTCALVSWSWLRTSRYHLIPSIEIRRQNARASLALLSSPYSTVSTSIRSLTIRAGKVVHPAKFIRYLPLINRFVLSASYTMPVVVMKPWLTSYSHCLAELILFGIGIDSFPEFVLFLPAFSVLRHITMISVAWMDLTFPDDRAINRKFLSPLSSLRSLILKGNSIEFLRWLLAHKLAPNITRLDLGLGDRRTIADVPQLSLDICGYYRTMGGGIYELDLYEAQSGLIDLSFNDNLRSLWFHEVVLSRGTWIADVLSHVTSPDVHTITLYIYTEEDGIPIPLDSFDWEALLLILSKSCFISKLRRINVRCLGFHDDALIVDIDRKLSQMPDITCDISDFTTETKFGVTIHNRTYDRA